MTWLLYRENSPRSIYYNSNMNPRLSGHFSIFGLLFFVLKSLLGIVRQWRPVKSAILTVTPRSHVRILIYRTRAINLNDSFFSVIYQTIIGRGWITKTEVCVICRSRRLRQIMQTRGFDNSWYHPKTEFNNCFIVHFLNIRQKETFICWKMTIFQK